MNNLRRLLHVRGRLFSIALYLGLLGASASSAHAQIFQVTSGDPGGGYDPQAVTYAALNLGGSGTLTLQGVTFTNSNPNVAITTTPYYFDTGPTDLFLPTTTPNDASLTTLASMAFFGAPYSYTGASLVLTISGLTVGTTYQLDTFSGLQDNYGARDLSIVAAGATTETLASSGGLIGNANFYDLKQSLQPDSSGVITVTYSDGPIPNMSFALSGLSITSPASAPEPSTWALLGVGLALLGFAARRRKSPLLSRSSS